MARVPANSYGNGTKYAGGNTFKKSDGSTFKVSGSYTSPSGKVSNISDNVVSTVASRDPNQIGNVYSTSGEVIYVNPSTGANSTSNAAQAYQDMLDSQLEARQSALSAGRRSLESDAKDASRQAYIQYMQSRKALPEQLSSVGINGGAAESSLLGLEGSYGNNLNSIESAKNKGLAELEAQYESGAATDTAAAQQYLAQLAEQQRQEAVARQNQLAAWQHEDSTAEKAYQYQLALANAEAALKDTGTSNGITKVDNTGVTNWVGADNSSIAVRGIGRISKAELANYIARGQVQAVQNSNGSISYRYVGK